MEERKIPVSAELIHVFETHYCMRFKFESDQKAENSSSNFHACFLLDRSGSMDGDPIRDAKGALISFISKMDKMKIPVTVIKFNNKYEVATSNSLGYDGLKKWAEEIDAYGGTLFKNVFEEMARKFVDEKLSETFVMLLSDGQDSQGLHLLTPSLEKFRTTIEKNHFSSSIHTIGFSRDHDAKLLTAITAFGTKPGTFQYIEKEGKIPVAVNNATEFLYRSSIWGQYIGPNKIPLKLEISDDEKNPKVHYGIAFVDEKNIENARVELFLQEQKIEYNLKLARSDSIELEDKVHIFTSYISNTMMQLLEKKQSKNLAKEEVPIELAKIGKMDKMLDELIAEIKRKRSLQRKQMMPFCLEAKDLINEFYGVLKEDVSVELSNVKVAQLNKLVYQNILQRSLLKKINKRVGENAEMLQKIDNEINKVLSSYDFKELDNINEQELLYL